MASLSSPPLPILRVKRRSSTSRVQPLRPRHSALGVRSEVRYMNVEEAKIAVDSEGYKVVDVRDGTQFERSHIANAVHVPLFVVDEANDIATLVRRQAHNSFAGVIYGLAFTKPNDKFVADVEEKVGRDTKMLLVCQEGLRSSTASEKLDDAGFSNVGMLTAGLQKVPIGFFPKEGKKELKDAGKGGFVTIQGPLSAVLAVILFGAYAFIEFFPDSATRLLAN